MTSIACANAQFEPLTSLPAFYAPALSGVPHVPLTLQQVPVPSIRHRRRLAAALLHEPNLRVTIEFSNLLNTIPRVSCARILAATSALTSSLADTGTQLYGNAAGLSPGTGTEHQAGGWD